MASPSSLPPLPPASPPLLDPKLQKVLLMISWMIFIGGGACALLFIWPLLAKILNILLPFLTALIFAYMFDPIVTFVQVRLRLNRIIGMLIFYLLVALVVVGFFSLLLPILYRQITQGLHDLETDAPHQVNRLLSKTGIRPGEFQTQLEDWMTSRGLTLESIVAQAGQSDNVRQTAKTAAAGGISLLARGFRQIYLFVVSMISGVMFAVLVIIINFYLLLDFSKIRLAIIPLLPNRWRERCLDIAGKLDHAVGGFLRGQLIDCALVGLLTTIGLIILGLKQYALLIGFVAGAANFIPYLGPLMGAAPAIAYVLLSSSYSGTQERLGHAALVVALFALIQTIDGLIFQPRIVGRAAQLHPVAVMLALAIGSQFGFMGMIVAVPVACMVRVLWIELFWNKRIQALKQQEKKT